MLEIKTERVNKSGVKCTAAIEGTGEDLIYEAYYAISGIVLALQNEEPKLKILLMKALAENDEWMHKEKKPSLGDVLGMIAKEGRFN